MFSIIIPVRGDVRIFSCLEKIFLQSYDKFEVIIIENGSDYILDAIRDKYHAQIDRMKLLKADRVGSFYARNRGIENAAGDILAFTDADCRVDINWLKNAKLFFDENLHSVLLGGKIDLHGRSNCLNAIETYESLFYLNQQYYIKSLGFAATANLFAKKFIFDEVGLFAANANAEEEREWCSRVLFKDYCLDYCENVRVAHPLRYRFLDFTRSVFRDVGAQIWYKRHGVHYLNTLWADKVLGFFQRFFFLINSNHVGFIKKMLVLLVLVYASVINLIFGVLTFSRIIPAQFLIEMEKK